MAYIAVFDIGTTSIKGMLVDEEAHITGQRSVLLQTHHGPDNEVEQNPEDWWQGIKEIAATWWQDLAIDPKQIVMITFSGQMEDVIPISKDHSSKPAILYSDTRAHEEAALINQKMPHLQDVTKNSVKASTPLAKLLWLKNRQPALYTDTECFVFSAKDYVIYQLTGSLITDATTGATTGMMNLASREWDMDVIEAMGIDAKKIPKLRNAEEKAGTVSNAASVETDFAEATPVLCGSGDAGASTMGAAAVKNGDSYFYIGTTGWAAVVQDEEGADSPEIGVFNLAHMPTATNISIAPLLNVGNVHNWAVDTFIGTEEENKYLLFESHVQSTSPGSNGLLFLPYLNGERSPVNDPDAKGAFWGIGPKTEKSDFMRAVMEGICFSFKQLIELLASTDDGTITLIGGGTKSSAWCQILADCIGRTVRVPKQSEFMPSIGAASSAFIQLDWAESYQDFADRFLLEMDAELYTPNLENYELYKEKYKQYAKLYPSLQGIYGEG